ncbi:MAG: Na/Pi cotransporter family protein [Lachnospiraceae bacterium]|nr:Na/Pi cotransporter family protein [Lachnospiraceae bacterium]
MDLDNLFALVGGVGLFLYGMTLMSSGLQNVAGDKMREILESVTSNRFKSVLLGVLVTLLIQSSSATDMMVIGFVNSGIMQLTEALGVILGANIGTTVTAQVTAFDLTAFAPFLLFAGCIMYLFLKKPTIKYAGTIILGFGMLFVGVGMIKEAILPLADSPWFISFISKLSNPFLAVIFGVLFTALLQSSSSATVIFQAFAIQGLLDYKTAVYLVIGAAIGSVTPNILASLTTNRNGKRTALLNLEFNLFRAVFLSILIGIFPGILDLIQSISPDNIGRQIANTHTIFAITAVLVTMPFFTPLVKLTERIIPILPEENREREGKKLLYMVDPSHTLPAVALRQAMLEVTRMGKMARNNLADSLESFFSKDHELEDKVFSTESIVDYLSHEITDKLVELRSQELSEIDKFRVSKLTLVVSNFERISDHAENIVEYKQKIGSGKEILTKSARKELKEMGQATLESIDASIAVFENEDFSLLPHAQELEEKVDNYQDEITTNHVRRLMKGKCDPMTGVVYTDIVTDLERCSDHGINIATALITPGMRYKYQR